jgi:hypothetical protein
MRRGGKKLSNIFKRFYTIFKRFCTIFERFLHKLARLMRKSALLIEILTLLRINLRVWFYPTLPNLPKMVSEVEPTPPKFRRNICCKSFSPLV